MRDEMDPPVYCSDRRLVKAAGMLRMIAATHGKSSVSLLDCLLLQHVLWYHPGDQRALKEWLLKRVIPETGMISCVSHPIHAFLFHLPFITFFCF